MSTAHEHMPAAERAALHRGVICLDEARARAQLPPSLSPERGAVARKGCSENLTKAFDFAALTQKVGAEDSLPAFRVYGKASYSMQGTDVYRIT
jgi:hypothetical protein